MKLFGGRRKRANWAISLDIGTEFVKALIFEVQEGKGLIKGTGRTRQKLSDMQGGGVTDINGVALNCQKAIEQAATQAQYLPEKAIVGIAGELVKGTTTFVKVTRAKPSTQLQLNELQEIVDQVQAESFKEARAILSKETGQDEIDVQLVNAAIVSVVIDGYKVSNPLAYQGKELTVGVYNAFAPIVQLGALETIVDQLGLELISIAAEPYAVARCLEEESTGFAATFVDIGGGTTDIAVVRNGGVEGTRMFAIGGRSFTKRIANVVAKSFNEAEEIKIRYAKGELGDDQLKSRIQEALAKDVRVWLTALQLSLEEFGASDLLPSRLLLCGGGSNLPEISQALSKKDWTESLPFARPPEIQFIKPQEVANMIDETKSLNDISDVTPMALGSIAVDLVANTSPLESIMKKAISSLRT